MNFIQMKQAAIATIAMITGPLLAAERPNILLIVSEDNGQELSLSLIHI